MENISNFEYNNIVSNADYLESTGIDLANELTSLITSDEDNHVIERFINGIEDWCKSYLMEHYTFYGALDGEYQTMRFKKAIIYQIQYVIRNGNISNDSGYNSSSGNVIPPEVLDKIGMAPNALREFHLGGMANFRKC